MKKTISLKQQEGALLVEGMIAILIFSLGILAIVGLQAASIRHTSDAKYRVDASFAANEAIGKIWSNRLTKADLAEVDTPVDTLPGGKRTVEVAADVVTVTITWKVPGEPGSHSYKTVTQIKG